MIIIIMKERGEEGEEEEGEDLMEEEDLDFMIKKEEIIVGVGEEYFMDLVKCLIIMK